MKPGYKLLAVLVIAFVFLNGKQESDKLTAKTPKQTESSIQLGELNISLQGVMSLTNWGRNPFLPYSHLISDDQFFFTDGKAMSKFKITYIFFQNGHRTALINQQKIQQGDRYLDKKVHYIGERLVILDNDNDSFTMLIADK
jgi:hypothetical protein